jgi:hypothetical protein
VWLPIPYAVLAISCHCNAGGHGLSCFVKFFFAGSRVGEKRSKKKRWLWPLGVMATGLTGAAVVVLRGCWHRKMSWPISSQNHSYQVCLGCGIKRLFDEHDFRAYGPYSYDLSRLIAWEGAQLAKASRRDHGIADEHRSAS